MQFTQKYGKSEKTNSERSNIYIAANKNSVGFSPNMLAGRAPGQTKHRQQLSLWVFCQHKCKVVIRNEYVASSGLQKSNKSASWTLHKPTLLRMTWTPSHKYNDQLKPSSIRREGKSKFAWGKNDNCPKSRFTDSNNM